MEKSFTLYGRTRAACPRHFPVCEKNSKKAGASAPQGSEGAGGAGALGEQLPAKDNPAWFSLPLLVRSSDSAPVGQGFLLFLALLEKKQPPAAQTPRTTPKSSVSLRQCPSPPAAAPGGELCGFAGWIGVGAHLGVPFALSPAACCQVAEGGKRTTRGQQKMENREGWSLALAEPPARSCSKHHCAGSATYFTALPRA